MAISLKLVHLSDLHFGDALYSKLPMLQTHESKVVESLSHSIEMIRKASSVPVVVVVTGDLTTFGTEPALSHAFSFLRGRVSVTGTQQVGLNDPNTPVIPGNHDIWGGWITGIGPSMAQPPSRRREFIKFFQQSAPNAVYPRSNTLFPYRLVLLDSPRVYLYGLDSNRIDVLPFSRVHGLFANGYVDKAQLQDLELLVNREPAVPVLRIAAIHHPITTAQFGTVRTVRGNLIESETVSRELRKLGFRMAISGHLHEGFLDSPNTNSQLHLFVVGTCSQQVNLSNLEVEALRDGPRFHNYQQLAARDSALRSTNEYRVYDFELESHGTDSVEVVMHRYVYVPSRGFDEVVHPVRIKIV